MVQMSALKYINVTGCENIVKVLLYSQIKYFVNSTWKSNVDLQFIGKRLYIQALHCIFL